MRSWVLPGYLRDAEVGAQDVRQGGRMGWIRWEDERR